MLFKKRQTVLLTLLFILLVIAVASMVGLYLVTQSTLMDDFFTWVFAEK